MNILFVCTGNTCRSPMAAGYLNALGLPGVAAESRGLAADGAPISENAQAVMAEKGIDCADHISRQITGDDIKNADKIICLSASHMAALLSSGVTREKLSVLGSGISDPFGGTKDIYRRCRDEIFAAVDTLVETGFFRDFEVIPMEERHIEAIAELERLCFSEPWSAKGIDEARRAGTDFFVAVRMGCVLGYVGIKAVLDEGYLANIAVASAERKKGIASTLLERIFTYAREKRLAFVSLEVRESNAGAIALYEKHGFRAEGRRKAFYSAPREDALILTKRFNGTDENSCD